MNRIIVRLVISPPLPPHLVEDVGSAVAVDGRLHSAINDLDINASVVSASARSDALPGIAEAVAARCRGTLSAGRAFRFEFFVTDHGELSDDAVRSIAVGLHGGMSAPVYVARRDTPAALWALSRPMPWGRKGLAVGQTAPSLPFGGSECLGVALEIGAATVLAKARLDGVPEHGLVRACAAVGGAESGFADVGAYPAVSAADGVSVVVLEFGNLKRSPLSRTLAVLDIEALRFGGHVGQATLLSHVPLDALLDVLRFNTGLDASTSQVLETHIPNEESR